MAKRKKRKIARISEVVRQINLEKMYGPEPEVKGIDLGANKSLYIDAFNWYWAMKDGKDARTYLASFFESSAGQVLYPEFLDILPNVPDEWINFTAAWIARMHLRGATIPDESYEFLYSKIEEMVNHVSPSKRITPKDRTSNEIAKLEGMIDDKLIYPGWDFKEYAEKNKLSKTIISEIINHFKPIFDEIMLALNKEDESVNEAYSKFTEEELELMAATYVTFTEFEQPKLEPPKPKDSKILTKLLPYAKVFEPLNLKSIPPERIIGAKELWVYNYAYNKFTIFRSTEGLSVNRTAISNFDEETSFSFKGKKLTNDYLTLIKTCTDHELEDTFDKEAFESDIVKFTSRLNDTTILLRVKR